MLRNWLFWVVNLLLQGGFWLLLVGKLDLWAGIAAAASAILAATAGLSYNRTSFHDYRPRLGDLAQFWRVPANIVADSGRVLFAAVLRLLMGRRPDGGLFRAEFDRTSSSEASCHAVATTYASLSPNSIVLGIVPEQRLVLYHQLLKRPVPSVLTHMGARR